MTEIQYPRFASLLDRSDLFEGVSKKGLSIITAVTVLTSMSIVFVLLRLQSKIRQKKSLSKDDYLLIAALLFLVTSAGLLYTSVKYGIGQELDHIPHEDRPIVVPYLMIAGQLAIAAAGLGQISISVTLLTIACAMRQRFSLWAIIVTVSVTKAVDIILMLTACQPIERWWSQFPADPSSRGCHDLRAIAAFWTFSCVWSAAVDLALVALAWNILWSLQMNRITKIGLGIAFGAGFFSAAIALIEAIHIPDGNYERDVTNTTQVIWTVAGPSVVVMAACVPFLHKQTQDLIKSLDWLCGIKRQDNQTASSEPIPLQSQPRGRFSTGASDEGRSDTASETSRYVPEPSPRAHLGGMGNGQTGVV